MDKINPGDTALVLSVPGTVMTGGVVSTTRTTNVPELRFPATSAASHRTVVSPSGNRAPDTGVHDTDAP